MRIKDENKCKIGSIGFFPKMKEYQREAEKEGWGLFESFGSKHGKWQVQHFDDGNLISDEEAWAIIANGEKPHHKAILAFIRYFNPAEYNRIMATRGIKVWQYTVSTNTIWTSFDYGEVLAKTKEEAVKKAIEELRHNFDKVNLVLGVSNNTKGLSINFAEDQVQVELKK